MVVLCLLALIGFRDIERGAATVDEQQVSLMHEMYSDTGNGDDLNEGLYEMVFDFKNIDIRLW